MTFLLAFLTFVGLLGLARIIDRKIPRRASVILKFFSLAAAIVMLVGATVLLPGEFVQTIFNKGSFNGNGPDKVIWSRIIVIAVAMFVWLFLLIRIIRISLSFKLEEETLSEARASNIERFVFDIAVIPNIVVFSMESLLFIIPLIICLAELGLVSKELVFSITFNKNKEVLA